MRLVYGGKIVLTSYVCFVKKCNGHFYLPYLIQVAKDPRKNIFFLFHPQRYNVFSDERPSTTGDFFSFYARRADSKQQRRQQQQQQQQQQLQQHQ